MEETAVHRISIDWTIDALIIISHKLNFICWANGLVWWFCNSYSSLQGLPGQILSQQHWERSQEMTTNFLWTVSPLKDDLLHSSILLETLESTLLRDWIQPFGQENERSTECLSACFFALSLRTGTSVPRSSWSLWLFWLGWLASSFMVDMFTRQRAKTNNYKTHVCNSRQKGLHIRLIQ